MKLPIGEYGFHLHKAEFRDALRLRYNWQLNSTPRTCTCGAQFTVDYAMICHMGGFPTIRHNEARDMTASLLRGGGTSSSMHVKKLHSILRYAESSRGFTEIKEVSARSIQVCRGSMGFNA